MKWREKCKILRNKKNPQDKNTMSKMKSSLVMVKIRWDNSDRKCVNLIKPIGTMKNEA